MTSAWSPKRLPESLLHYMSHAGQGPHHVRVGLPGAVDSSAASARPRRSTCTDEVRDAWLYGNAESFFFGGPSRARS